MMRSPKMDENFTKVTLDYIVIHDSLPDNFVMTLGHVLSVQPVDDFYMMNMRCFYKDDLARSAKILERYTQLLMAKSNRKVSDTAQTLDFLMNEANDLLFSSPEDMAGYKALKESIDGCAKINSYLWHYAEQIQNITIKEVAKLDSNICKLIKMAYKIMRHDFEALVDKMFEDRPEYKTKIKRERLIELFANTPVALAIQFKTGMLPSDVKALPSQT